MHFVARRRQVTREHFRVSVFKPKYGRQLEGGTHGSQDEKAVVNLCSHGVLDTIERVGSERPKYDASAHATDAMKKTRQRGIKLIFKGTLEDLDEEKIYRESFGALTPTQRLEEGWKMVEHVWELKGRSLNELRFNRTVAVIKRP